MKKLLIAATLLLACCTSHPQTVAAPPASGTGTADCRAGDTSPDCVWPDGRPK